MSYPLPKLKRSLARRVKEQLEELIPQSSVTVDKEVLHLVTPALQGTVNIGRMAEACHREDRALWGTIAGSFVKLVVSRVEANSIAPLADATALDQVLPAVQPESPDDDALIADATPIEDLVVASVPWLPGIRVEFDFGGDEARNRRLFLRDLRTIGVDAATVAERAVDNMKNIVSDVPIRVIPNSSLGGRVLAMLGEGRAPAMLRAPSGHEAMFAAYRSHNSDEPFKILACAPRSDQVLFCSIRDKAAAAAMVSRAWSLFEGEIGKGVPLSPRLFVVAEPGDVKYLDVGIPADRVADWKPHDLDGAIVRVPEDWYVSEQDDRFVIWPGEEGPRIRARIVDGNGSPGAASQLAEKVRAKQGVTADVGYGFFNGLPWAWVDTGMHDGYATASMFVVANNKMVIFQTEVPEGTPQKKSVVLQKIIATVSPGLG